jgi:rhamnosyltransferase
LKSSYRVAGVVVLYNPNEDVINNINTYIEQVDVLYAVDNSEVIVHDVIDEIKRQEKVAYMFNGGNYGIARALNMGGAEAIKQGFDFLLTMDQDSKAPPNMVVDMLKCIEGKSMSTVGIVSPFHVHGKKTKPPKAVPFEEVLTVMTSGNLLNLDVFKKVGGFMEKLFIDHVDHEYCLRLNLKGYKVMQVNNVALEHDLGEMATHGFFFGKLDVITHSPVRLYYKTRNGFYVANEYNRHFPEFYRRYIIMFVKDLIRAIFFEKDKLKRLHMILRGYVDYKKDNFGKR